jgi:hypothetical protein
MSDLSIEECLVLGSENALTTDLQNLNKPFVTRGITQKPELDFCVSKKRDYYFVDTGYLGNFPSPGNPNGKKKFHRIVKNDIQHCLYNDKFPDDRWNKLVSSDPRLQWKGWKKFNKKILLVIPNPKACRFYGIDQEQWVNDTTEKIKSQTDLPIEVRIKGSRSYRNHEYTIYDAFDSGVYATVAFNSIAALESVLYGIPAFVTVPCAAAPLASMNLDLSKPVFPEVEKILKHCCRLAYGQFTLEEIQSGFAWKILKKY